MYDIPLCLEWCSPESTLPAEFLNKNLADFKSLLNALCDPVREQGLLHHSSLLAMGLLTHHVLRADLPSDHPNFLKCGLNTAHKAVFKETLAIFLKAVKGGPAAQLLDKYDFPAHKEDKSGIRWPRELPLRAGDEGSPAMAAQDRRRAIEFVTGLSNIPTYVDTCSAETKWVSPCLVIPCNKLIIICRSRSTKWVGQRACRPFSRGSGHHTTVAASHRGTSRRRSFPLC